MKVMEEEIKMIDKTKAQKDSHSSGIYIRLPKSIVDSVSWKPGDVLIIRSTGKKLEIEREVE